MTRTLPMRPPGFVAVETSDSPLFRQAHRVTVTVTDAIPVGGGGGLFHCPHRLRGIAVPPTTPGRPSSGAPGGAPPGATTAPQPLSLAPPPNIGYAYGALVPTSAAAAPEGNARRVPDDSATPAAVALASSLTGSAGRLPPPPCPIGEGFSVEGTGGGGSSGGERQRTAAPRDVAVRVAPAARAPSWTLPQRQRQRQRRCHRG